VTKHSFSFYVLITMRDGTHRGMNVLAASEKEAKQKAQLQAALEGWPVFDCKIEVKR